MTWNAAEHTDEENLRWCWLRAVEWGRWPVFLSRFVAPPLLIWFRWEAVVLGTIAANVLWAIFVRYRIVSVSAAFIAVNLLLLRWLSWPIATAYLFTQGRKPECWFSAFWPLLIYVLGEIPPVQVGPIQLQFMQALGYEPTAANPLSRGDRT